MNAREIHNYKPAQVNCYGYGGMWSITKAQLHANVLWYFDLSNLSFGDDFATCSPAWSSVQSFIATAI